MVGSRFRPGQPAGLRSRVPQTRPLVVTTDARPAFVRQDHGRKVQFLTLDRLVERIRIIHCSVPAQGVQRKVPIALANTGGFKLSGWRNAGQRICPRRRCSPPPGRGVRPGRGTQRSRVAPPSCWFNPHGTALDEFHELAVEEEVEMLRGRSRFGVQGDDRPGAVFPDGSLFGLLW